jgi:hypothetical protein
MNTYPNTTISHAGDWLLGTARRNPEALLLLAAGCALLMRTGSGMSRPTEDDEGWTHENGYSTASATARSREALAGSAREASGRFSDVKDRVTDTASGYVSDMKQRVSDTAADYANNITGRVSDTASSVAESATAAGRNVVEGSRNLTRQAQTTLQSTIEGVLRDQPLAVAAVGFAAGAAVAAAFPSTDAEVRALGGARESLSEAVDQAGKRVMGAAGKAGEHLKAAAEEKGLTADGLKNIAGEVTTAFTGAVASGGQGAAAPQTTTSSNTGAEPTKPVVSDDSGVGGMGGGTQR